MPCLVSQPALSAIEKQLALLSTKPRKVESSFGLLYDAQYLDVDVDGTPLESAPTYSKCVSQSKKRQPNGDSMEHMAPAIEVSNDAMDVLRDIISKMT